MLSRTLAKPPSFSRKRAKPTYATLTKPQSHLLTERPSAPIQSYQNKPSLVKTINWHLTPNCNYRCSFCFATFQDLDKKRVLDRHDEMLQVGWEAFAHWHGMVQQIGDAFIHINKKRPAS